MGQIIKLSDNPYEYELPSLPRENEIWYYDVPKSEQYWLTPFNKNHKWLNPRGDFHNVRQMSERDKIEYIEYWRRVIEEGLWIMVNGEPTYMTGMHVEHLLFNRLKSTRFIYLASQRERFYFRDLTDKAPNCDGRLWAKGRRVGITMEQVTHAIRCILNDFGNHVGAQSDTLPKAKSTILDKLISAYIKRPQWAREDFYSVNGKVPKSSLQLIDSIVRYDDDYPLGGTARVFPTTSKALDGEEFMLVVMDELSKWADVSPMETFEVNKKTITNPGKRGKLDALSTTGDSKEAMKAVRDWHKLISDSNPKVINQNGQTNSGLWYYFVSYIHSLELMENLAKIGKQVVDKYGTVNREMAEEYIWNDVKKYPKDSKEYIFALYKMPMELRHTLLTQTGQGYFSKIRIANRLDYLRSLPNDRKPYVRGRFEYERDRDGNENRFGKVIFVPDEFGHWYVALHPYFSAEKNIDTRNRWRRINGVFHPPINREFGIGYDPIRYKKDDTTSTSLSEAAIIVYKKFDYFNSGESNGYAALYLHRPDDPRDATKECIKACKYFGAKCAHERTMERVKEDFDNENCLPFLTQNPKDGLYGFSVDAQGKLVKNATDIMVTKFSPPKTPEEPDMIATMPFEPVLTDLDGIDLSRTTEFDTYMSMVQLEQELMQMQFTTMTDQTTVSQIKLLDELMPRRN